MKVKCFECATGPCFALAKCLEEDSEVAKSALDRLRDLSEKIDNLTDEEVYNIVFDGKDNHKLPILEGELIRVLNMKRVEDNRKLLYILIDLIETYPGMRFSQILVNFGFVSDYTKVYDEYQQRFWLNEFSKEPEEILKRVKETLRSLNEKQ